MKKQVFKYVVHTRAPAKGTHYTDKAKKHQNQVIRPCYNKVECTTQNFQFEHNSSKSLNSYPYWNK